MSTDPSAWTYLFWPGTEVLKNKLGEHDPDRLAAIEADLTALRLYDLRSGNAQLPGHLDLAHLQAIHHYIFQDVYDWAGQLRTFPLFKEESEFCRPEHIESYAAKVFGRLEHNNYLCGLREEAFLDHAAELLADLNALHPFREGNGRSQRAFLSHVADLAGHPIIWPEGIAELNIAASRDAMLGDHSGLREILCVAHRLAIDLRATPASKPHDTDDGPTL